MTRCGIYPLRNARSVSCHGALPQALPVIGAIQQVDNGLGPGLTRHGTKPAVYIVVYRLLKDRVTGVDTGGTGSGGGERVSPYSQALKMFRSGHLDEQVIAGALSARDYSFVQASLAVRSGLPETVIRRTVAARSAKGLLALTWKGGLSVHLAERLQRNLARIPPDEVLVAKKGKYPLTKDEMNWQIKFFVSLESQHRPSGGGG